MEVILYVEDMSAQARFYCDRLGLKVEGPLGAQHLDELYWVELDTGPAH
jgi:catechol 2,3-dioxygenase-like lactoylglutathione lyase family enzyme